jgi:hypothetical protein
MDRKRRRSEKELMYQDLKNINMDGIKRKRRRKRTKKTKNQTEKEKEAKRVLVQIDEALQTVSSEGWKVNKRRALERPQNVRVSEPDFAFFGRTQIKNPLAIIDKLLPDSIWLLLEEGTEKRRVVLLNSKLFPVGKPPAKRSSIDYRWKQPIGIPDLKRYYGWSWLWETKYPNFSYKRFKQEMDKNPPMDGYDEYKLTIKRYHIISQCLDADIAALSSQISDVQMKGWKSGEFVAADETILGWLGEGEFKVNIKGKPTPEGLMIYALASFSDKEERKPYLLAVEPHWGHPKPKPLDCVKRLLQRFKTAYSFCPHAVLDARFTEKPFLNWIVRFGSETMTGGATIALPSTHMVPLFSLLSIGVGVKQWRCAYSPCGKMASFKRVMCLDEKKVLEWRVVSWGWGMEGMRFEAPTTPFTLPEFKMLSSFSRDTLVFMARKMGLVGEGDSMMLAESIAEFSRSERQLVAEGLEKPEKRKEKCEECAKLKKEEMCEECLLLRRQIEEGRHEWSKEDLDKLQKPELLKICGELGLKKVGNKPDLKKRILLSSDLGSLQNVEKRMTDFLGAPRRGRAEMHSFYKSQFSVVDKMNQTEFGTQHPGRCHREVARMIMGLLKIPIGNVRCILDYELADEDNAIDYLDLRIEIALHLIQSRQKLWSF